VPHHVHGTSCRQKLLRSTDSFHRKLKTFLFEPVFGHQGTCWFVLWWALGLQVGGAITLLLLLLKSQNKNVPEVCFWVNDFLCARWDSHEQCRCRRLGWCTSGARHLLTSYKHIVTTHNEHSLILLNDRAVHTKTWDLEICSVCFKVSIVK